MTNRLATVKEACAYAKMGMTRLYARISAGEIIAYKRNRRTLIDLDSIDALNARELKPWKPDKAPGRQL
jgi:Helix-turn-helix domain